MGKDKASTPGLPAAYDVSALVGGISPGGTVAGFAVEFRWLGSSSDPGAQEFQVYDPNTFALLQNGTTTPIPEPSTSVLFCAGLLGLAAWRGKIHPTDRSKTQRMFPLAGKRGIK